MLHPHVNILAFAYREDAPYHARYKTWMQDLINSDAAYGMSDLVLSGFLRVVTHPRIFSVPSTIEGALAFVEEVSSLPNCVPITPGVRHWDIFARLCRSANTRGNLVPDAYFAALAIESGGEWVTTDGDYGRFPGLRWRRPF